VKVFACAMGLAFLAAIAVLTAQNTAATVAPANDNPLAGLNLTNGSAAATAAAPVAGFAARMTQHLVVLDGDQVKTFDSSALAGVKYWAFYYSASWCPPCRAFTPSLVEFYKSFKPQHPNFELIFVNDDRSEDAMTDYMKADAMSWPAVRFDDIDDSGAKKYMGPGIPDLVLVDENGNVLADSFNGSEYVGPQTVVDAIQRIVK
jgi:nucleoredoxin